MRNCEPELVIKNDRIAVANEFCDYFFAYAMWNESLYSTNTRYPTKLWTEFNSRNVHNEQVTLTRYDWDEQAWVSAETIDLGQGGDPRITSDGDLAYALIIGSFYSGSKLIVYDFKTGERIPIQMANPMEHIGKNWQPFIRDGELFAVHSLNPFRIVKIDLNRRHAEFVSEHGADFKIHCDYESFTIFRGGANVVVSGDQLLGIGRTTTSRVRHTPFFWTFTHEGQFSFTFCELFQPLLELGYNIIDPTSMFYHNGDLYLALACSERDWVHTQIVSDYLLRFPGIDSSEKVEPEKLFSTYLATRYKCRDHFKPDLSRHLFLSDDLFATTEHYQDNFRGRTSTGKSGSLLHGPYAEIKEAGSYTVELAYYVKSGPDMEDYSKRLVTKKVTQPDETIKYTYELFDDDSSLTEVFSVVEQDVISEKPAIQTSFGTFDVNILQTWPEPSSEIIAATEIVDQGTGMSSIRLKFTIDEIENKLLETRVFVNQDAILTVYGVRIWRDDLAVGGHEDYPWADIFWGPNNHSPRA